MLLAKERNDVLELNQSLIRQIDEIANQVLANKSEVNEPGLLGGKAGIALLFGYLSNAFPGKNYKQVAFDYLDELSDALSNDELNYNMSSGVAGIGFIFQHFRNIGILDSSEDLNLNEIDEFISLGIDNDFKTGNWDPLHGMTGLGIYFLERHIETGGKKYLEKIIDCLAEMRIDSGLWITPGYEKFSNDNYNFGMAHGMPGVLSFLAQSYGRGIRQKEIYEIISSALQFLLKQEYNDPVYCFPLTIDVIPKGEMEKPNSRLGWCYGDLCMAIALIHCGDLLGRCDWKEKGIEIALKTTLRTFENAGCNDAPFCHGTSGLVHIYNRLYQNTANEIFRNASQNWLELTSEHFYKQGEGAGGYFFRTYKEEENNFEMTANYSLLEGSAGIALTYLSIISDLKPDWDKIFLTNV